MIISKKLISNAFIPLGLTVLLLSSCAQPQVTRSVRVDETYAIQRSPACPTEFYHKVAPGETLWRISKMYDVDVDVLRKVNNIGDVRDIEIGSQLLIPSSGYRKDIVTLYPNNKWLYIVVHHSATDVGNSMEFNKAHIKKGWQGVGYHFVIDNGTCGKQNGQIEMTPRWTGQLDGAHCKAAGMNEKGIGICLVGNFSETNVSDEQLNSLVQLTRILQEYYNIPKSKVIGHRQAEGARTECPGKRFPWQRFKRLIR